MQITRPDEKHVLLSQIDPLLAELLRRIPASADPADSDAARTRLFSPPTEDAGETELLEDWQLYITPELEQLFQSALEVVQGDLRKLHTDAAAGEAQLTLPLAHLEKWIHSLNQARLAIAARHGFEEEDMQDALPLAADPRSLALFQMRFYGFLQELFLRELEED